MLFAKFKKNEMDRTYKPVREGLKINTFLGRNPEGDRPYGRSWHRLNLKSNKNKFYKK